MADARGRDTDELEDVELVVELDEQEPRTPSQEAAEDEAEDEPVDPEEPRPEIRLSREQTLQDLRELQNLSIERAEGRSSREDD